MKIAFAVIAAVLAPALWGYEVSVDVFVANPGQRVVVPVTLDTVKGAANVGVRIAYDAQVLTLMKVARGSLSKVLSNDFVVGADERNGSVWVSAFGDGDVLGDEGGTLATLVFEVRDGTQGLYSDIAVSNVSIGEQTGVRDMTVENRIAVRSGMIRVMAKTATVDRLGGCSQVICADAELGELSLKAGDTLQASGRQSPIVVTRGVTSEGTVDVMPPSEGWASGRYKLLSTTSAGLGFALQGADGLEVAYGSEATNGVVTYYADVNVPGEVRVACEEEALSSEAENRIRAAIVEAGTSLADVKRISVTGPKGNVALIADLGIAPAVSPVDLTGTLSVAYAMPKMVITSFDPQTGVLGIRVEPGVGNKIVAPLATGYVHVYGTASLSQEMKKISRVGFDLTPYLRPDTKGEATLTIDLGSYSFIRVKVE